MLLLPVRVRERPRLHQATMTELVYLLGNKTLLLMGDSVMEQFYNTLQCYLRKVRGSMG